MATPKKRKTNSKVAQQITASSPAPKGPARMAADKISHNELRESPRIIKAPVKELHTCMGLNSCKDKGYSGDNACVGQGDCATVKHSCHTLNECKGQGGCGLFGTTAEFCHPGENDCKYQGSCGSPIPASRFISSGPNKGLSVWQLARKRFAEKMSAKGKTLGPVYPGQEYGPTIEFLANKAGTTSCGQSGDRYCSYSPTDTAKKKYDRRAAFGKKSSETPYSSDECS